MAWAPYKMMNPATICHYFEKGSTSLNMVRSAFVMLVVVIVSCLAAPGERVRRHGYDYGHGGYGGGYGGYGGHGLGGAGGHGHGLGYGGGAHVPVSQSFSKSSASASSSSLGGGVVG